MTVPAPAAREPAAGRTRQLPAGLQQRSAPASPASGGGPPAGGGRCVLGRAPAAASAARRCAGLLACGRDARRRRVAAERPLSSSCRRAIRGGFPGWLAGPLHGLGVLDPAAGRRACCSSRCSLCYLIVLACARAVPARGSRSRGSWSVHLVFLLAPPLFSADVFGYIDYARLLRSCTGSTPTCHGAAAAPHDPVVPVRALARYRRRRTGRCSRSHSAPLSVAERADGAVGLQVS